MKPAQPGEKTPIGIWVLIVLALVVSNLPLGIGFVTSTSHRQFLGFDFFDDFHNYSMYIYESAHSDHIFLQNRNNAEFDGGHYLWPLFWVLGKIVAWTGLSIPFVFMLGRLVIGFVFLWLVWRLLRHVVSDSSQRVIAFFVVCLGAGFGWLIRLASVAFPYLARIKGGDLDYTGGYNTLSGLMFPLQTLAFALFVAMLLAYLNYRKSMEKKYLVAMAVAGMLIPFVHPPSVAIAWGVFGLAWILQEFAERKKVRQWLAENWKPLVALAIPLFAFGVYFLFAMQDPNYAGSFRTYLDWARRDTPLMWPVGFGLVGLLALLGARKFESENAFAKTIVWSWLAIGLALGLAPQGKKFLIGAFIPMAIIASAGAVYAARRWIKWNERSTLQRVGVGLAVFFLLFSTHIVNAFDKIHEIESNPNARLSSDEIMAMQFLEKQPYGTVLSSYRIGNNVVWMTPHKAYLGHWGETLGFSEKSAKATRFFDPAVSPEEKIEFLSEAGITYVFSEKDSGLVTKGIPLVVAYQNRGATVYRVTQ